MTTTTLPSGYYKTEENTYHVAPDGYVWLVASSEEWLPDHPDTLRRARWVSATDPHACDPWLDEAGRGGPVDPDFTDEELAALRASYPAND